MAIVARFARDRSRSNADARLAFVGFRARIFIVARRPIGDVRMHGNTSRANLRSAHVAIIERQIGIIRNLDERSSAVAYLQ